MSGDLTLVMLATGGTAALVGAAFALGFNKSGRFKDDVAAAHLVSTYVPGAMIKQTLISNDQTSALVRSDQDEIYFATFVGDSPVARRLKSTDLTLKPSGYLFVDVKDFGFPVRKLRFNRDALEPMLQLLREGPVS
jgi:hypothetical protein